MAAAKTVYVCEACGHSAPKRVGRCPQCGEWNTMHEQAHTSPRPGRADARTSSRVAWTRLADVDEAAAVARIDTGIGELNRVLGGGMVPGSYIVLGAEPGAGKALALDTPVWADFVGGDAVSSRVDNTVTLGNAARGRKGWSGVLFDENGSPCRIRERSEVMTDRPCFAIEFEDLHGRRETIVADAQHQWVIDDVPVPCTSEQLEQILAIGVVPTVTRHARAEHVASAGHIDLYLHPLQEDVVFTVTRVTPTPSVPVQCIEVTSESHLFLVGEMGIPTHNSTLATQLAISLTETGKRIAIVCGEESMHQVKGRFHRLGGGDAPVALTQETCIEQIVAAARTNPIDLLVVDSIQTVYSADSTGTPGSIGQVRECGHQLVEVAKEIGTTVLLIGQVTKEGSLAGPRALEHLVDVVMAIEGERDQQLRILRAAKNRFGTTDEVGVFEMTGAGMTEVSDPSSLFVSGRDTPVAGSVVCPTIEGTRPVLVEVQALCNPSPLPQPIRAVQGINPRRLQMLLAVMTRGLGYRVGSNDVFVNLGGGLQVQETAIDAAVATSVASAISRRIPYEGVAVCGEVSLMGELRPVPQQERRVSEAKRLGYDRVITPATASTLKEVIEQALSDERETAPEGDDD